MDISSIKRSILKLASSAISKELTTTVAAGIAIGATTATSVALSPFITIPALLGAYLVYSKAEETLSKKTQEVQLELIFEKIKKEFCPKLQQIRDTEITILEKELNNAIAQKDAKELQQFIIKIFEDQSSTLADIAAKLSYTEDDIHELKKSAETILQLMDDIRKENTQVHAIMAKDINDIKTIQESIFEYIKKCEPSRETKTVRSLCATVYSSTFSVHVVTGYCDYTDFDDILNNVINNIFQGKIIEASEILDKLLETESITNSIVAKIWILALRGQAILASGDIIGMKDVNLSRELGGDKKEDLCLKLIYAHAEKHYGNKEKALEYVNEILAAKNQEYSIEARSLWIELCGLPLEQIESIVSRPERENPKILESLAKVYLFYNDYRTAEFYARESINLAPKSKYKECRDCLSDILFAKKFGDIIFAGFSKPFIDKKSWHDFSEVLSGYEYAYNEKKLFACDLLKSALLYNILIVHFVVNDKVETLNYIDKLLECETIEINTFEIILAILARYNLYNQAIEIISQRKSDIFNNLSICNKYAEILLATNNREHKVKAYEILRRCADKFKGDGDLNSVRSVLLLGALLRTDNNDDEYQELISAIKEKHSSLTAKVLQVHQMVKINSEQSKGLISEILKQLPSDNFLRSFFIIEILSILEDCGETEKILELLDGIVFRDELNSLGRKYFNYAAELNDSNRISKFCRDLRNNGCYVWEIINNEIQFTRRFGNKSVISLIESIIDAPQMSEHKSELELWLCLAKLACGELESSPQVFQEYPSIDEINEWYPWCNIPIILSHTGRWQQAIDYMYNLCLRFPHVDPVIGIFKQLMAFPSKDKGQFPVSDIVRENFAVIYRVDSDTEDKFLIIEQSQYASKARHEYSASDKNARPFLGKRVGDAIYLNAVIPRKIIIKEIKHKALFLFHKLLHEEGHLPDSSFSLIHTPIKEDGKLDTTELKELLVQNNNQQLELIETAKQLYIEKLPSIYLFSLFSGLPLSKTIAFFCGQDELCIDTAIGTRPERITCDELFKDSKYIILTPLSIELILAISAGMDFDICDILRKCGKQFVVSEYILETLLIDTAFPCSNGNLCLVDGQPIIVDNVYSDNYYKYLQKFRLFLGDKSLVIVADGKLSEVDFEYSKRNGKGIIGRPLYHSLQLATQYQESILWEDDKNIVELCNKLFPSDINVTRRIFTQAMAFNFVISGIMAANNLTKINIFLIAVNEVFTCFNTDTLFEIFSKSREFKSLVPRVLRFIGLSETTSLVPILSSTIAELLLKSHNFRRTVELAVKPLLDNCLHRDKKMTITVILNTVHKVAIDKNVKKSFIRFLKDNYSDIISIRELT